MKPWDNSPRASDDRRLDLLVDGELGEAERSELLRQLDREPGGWRKLALAFLEAQAWKQAIGAMAARQRPAASGAQPASNTSARRQGLPLGWIGTVAAMAASFLFAAALGLMVIRNPGGLPMPGEGLIADGSPTPRAVNVATGNALSAPRETAVAAISPKQWQTVRVALPTGPQGNGETVELPAIERDRLDEALLSSLPAALPPEVLGALHGRGYEVRQRRELLPVNLQDGRGLVVPVDQVELRYVGEQKYQ